MFVEGIPEEESIQAIDKALVLAKGRDCSRPVSVIDVFLASNYQRPFPWPQQGTKGHDPESPVQTGCSGDRLQK
ncbi:hypothetical protein [Ruegeria jejuensis]|uniref:hypothetical protein n=1 Tax=Ruegeria jejuensis TaxID=3233338 RepID=UPI00355B6EC1